MGVVCPHRPSVNPNLSEMVRASAREAREEGEEVATKCRLLATAGGYEKVIGQKRRAKRSAMWHLAEREMGSVLLRRDDCENRKKMEIAILWAKSSITRSKIARSENFDKYFFRRGYNSLV